VKIISVRLIVTVDKSLFQAQVHLKVLRRGRGHEKRKENTEILEVFPTKAGKEEDRQVQRILVNEEEEDRDRSQ